MQFLTKRFLDPLPSQEEPFVPNSVVLFQNTSPVLIVACLFSLTRSSSQFVKNKDEGLMFQPKSIGNFTY